jgi:biotin carboxyl carrier protein
MHGKPPRSLPGLKIPRNGLSIFTFDGGRSYNAPATSFTYLARTNLHLINSVSKAHDHIPAPYRVRIGSGDPVDLDPAKLAGMGIRLDHIRGEQYVLHAAGRTIPVLIEATDRKNVRLSTQNRTFEATVLDHRDQLLAEWGLDDETASASDNLSSPMPGLVLSVSVEVGAFVSAGSPLLVLEAMKMENEIKASADCTIASIGVKPGDAVQKGQILIEFEKNLS